MTSMESLAARLIEARHTHTLIDSLPEELKPVSAADAYLVQRLTIAGLGGGAGYKIGAKSPTDEPQCAPLPASKVFGAANGVQRADYARTGLELEIAFSFATDIDRTFAERTGDILDAIDTMSVVVEVVDSRFKAWPQVDKLAQLADLQNNGALVTGDTVRYDRRFDFVAPEVRFYCGEQEIFSGRASNPAGDPRRLIVWLVGRALQAGQTIPARSMLTTGSYTGMYFPEGPDRVRGSIEGIGSIEFDLT
ncbi:2-keto-4-pentenoate hydratase [Paraburkholderia sp. GAS448]|uniref:2-keto-4-pentenoate hydratase n=1 Tax=Paraburkholderia sp. GAS448 TaxID=3035136 RepID=UPI003D24631B